MILYRVTFVLPDGTQITRVFRAAGVTDAQATVLRVCPDADIRETVPIDDE